MATKTKRKPRKAVAKVHERTEKEIAYMQDFFDRKADKREVPKITFEMKDDGTTGVCKIESVGDSDITKALMLDAFGTTDERFMDGLLKQLANVGQYDFNFMFSIVAGLEPQDQIEAMLTAQMAAVHMATMGLARRLNHTETIEQQDSAERAFNKLARTFTTQIEALNRHRGKAQQKMVVEHVHVYEGGQAVVGNVQGGGGQKIK